jgi:hypothetical protein
MVAGSAGCPASMQVSWVWVITRNRVITQTQDAGAMIGNRAV